MSIESNLGLLVIAGRLQRHTFLAMAESYTKRQGIITTGASGFQLQPQYLKWSAFVSKS
jgi:hypothetical protein